MALVVTIAGVDRTAVVKEDTIRITQLADSYTFTAELVVFDASSNITIVAGSHKVADEITMVDGATTFFGGYLANQDIATLEGGSRNLSLQCQGYGILPTETLVEYEEYAATADDAIIDDLFDTYLAVIDSVTDVAQLDASISISFTEMSLAEIMEAICQRTGGRFYIDNSKGLHYFADENDDCGFDLSDTPNQVTSFSYYEDTEKRVDASQIVNSVRVVGADGYSVNRTDATSITAYGTRQTLITDHGLTTTAELEERGDAILDKYKDPLVTYVVRTTKAGAVAGQEVDYKNVKLGLAALTTQTIREMYIYWEQGDPVYEMVLGEAVTFSLQRNAYTSTQLRSVTVDLNPLAQRGWSHDLVFTASDEDTVAWAGGDIKLAGGTGTFAIAGGNTGNIAALTYIYLDTDVSVTALQVTTSAADSLGANKILMAVAKNVTTGDCEFQVFGGEENAESYLFADDAAVNQLIANIVGANSLVVSAANIETGIIKNLHVTSTFADRIQANKIRIGPLPFTPDEGLILLGQPISLERGATNYWVSPRRQKATIAGALHPVQGKWQGTQALYAESARTNLIDNPSFETNTTGWTGVVGNTIARTTDEAKNGDYSLECTQGDGVNFAIAVHAITLPGAGTYTFSANVKLAADWDADAVYLRHRNFTGSSVYRATTTIDETGRWKRLQLSFTVVGGDLVGDLDVVVTTAAGTSKIAYVDSVQCEGYAQLTSYLDGSLGDGYAWTGAAHASTSTRAASYLNLIDFADLIDGNNVMSFHIVAQPGYDADESWAEAQCALWDFIGAGAVRLGLIYDAGDNRFEVLSSVGVLLASPVQTFKAGEPITVDVTVDFTNDEYALYVNGVLVDTATNALSAITGITAWYVGVAWAGNAAFWGGPICEFAVFDDLLTEVEVAEVYEINKPMVDYGSSETPGILLTSHSGNRIEITAYEIVVYEDNDKCVEVDTDGIAILTTSAYADIRSYQFVDASLNVVSRLAAYYNTGTNVNSVELSAVSVASYDSAVNVRALSPSGEIANVTLDANQGAKYADVSCNVSIAGISTITIVADGVICAVGGSRTDTDRGLAVYGLQGEVWRFRDVAAGADRANTRRFHVTINGTQYTLHGETGWV